MVLKWPSKGPVPILTLSFRKLQIWGIIFEGTLFIWNIVLFVLLLMKSSHVENLRNAKLNHFVNFMNLQRPQISSSSALMIFFLCDARHIPEQKTRIILVCKTILGGKSIFTRVRIWSLKGNWILQIRHKRDFFTWGSPIPNFRNPPQRLEPGVISPSSASISW